MSNTKIQEYEVKLIRTGKYEELKKRKRRDFERPVLLLQLRKF